MAELLTVIVDFKEAYYAKRTDALTFTNLMQNVFGLVRAHLLLSSQYDVALILTHDAFR